MKQVVIENPVIDSPFREPRRHFKLTDEGIANEVFDGRRSCSYFVSERPSRKKGQKPFEFHAQRIRENGLWGRKGFLRHDSGKA